MLQCSHVRVVNALAAVVVALGLVMPVAERSSAAGPSTLAGAVTNSDGAPVEGVTVEAYGWSGGYEVATTGADGAFSLSVAEDLYNLRFAPPPDTMYREAQLNDIQAIDGATVDVSIVLVRSGEITGIVTDDTGAPLAWVSVSADGPGWSGAMTDDNGRYRLIVAPGDFILSFNVWDSPLLSEWYPDARDPSGATPVHVDENGAVTIDAQLERGAVLTGVVTGADGQPIAGVQVVYESPYGSAYTDTTTDGRYTFVGLAAAEATVTFRVPPNTSRYVGTTRYAVMVPPSTTTLDVELEVGGVIRGVVTDGTSGLVGVLVEVRSEDWSHQLFTTTGVDGSYEVVGLPAGMYIVRFEPWGLPFEIQYFDGSADLESATLVEVSNGAEIAGVSAELVRRASFTGRVVDNTGTGVAFTTVHAVPVGAIWPAFTDFTDADGYFTLVADPGDYNIGIVTSAESGLQGEWYLDAATQETASVVSLGAGQTVALADTVLEPRPTISGTVTANGQPVAGVSVVAYIGRAPFAWAAWTSTDDSGFYELRGLAPGEYTLHFQQTGGFSDEWWQDMSDQQSATMIQLDANEQFVANVTMSTGGGISGTVIERDGTPVPFATVNLSGGGMWFGVSTDENGRFTITNLDAGSYTVSVQKWDSSYVPATWSIDLAADEQVTGFDLVVDRYANISGDVIDTAGDPVAWTPVLLTPDGGSPQWRWTDSQGRYGASGLAAGSYTVTVMPSAWAMQLPASTTVIAALNDDIELDFVLDRHGSIVGTVVDERGDPVAWTPVSLTGPTGLHYSAWTDEGGRFVRGPLDDGVYLVEVRPPVGARYLPASRYVTVALNTVTDGGLVVPLAGHVQGRVSSNRDATVGEVEVALISAVSLEVIASTAVAADGRYDISGVVPGEYYVRFLPAPGNRHMAEWYPDVRRFDQARTVTVVAGDTTTVDAELLLRGVASAYVPVQTHRSVEQASASFVQAVPWDTCWTRNLDVTVSEVTTYPVGSKPVTATYVSTDLWSENDCFGYQTDHNRGTSQVSTQQASVDPYASARAVDIVVSTGSPGSAATLDLHVEWAADGNSTVVNANDTDGAGGTHTLEWRTIASLTGTVTVNGWIVFTAADVEESGIATFKEVVIV